MALLPILTYPDPRLRTVAEPVTSFDDSLKVLIKDMFDTMYDSKGIGLAATQVDRHIRVIVMDLAKEGEEPAPQVFINPTITPLTEELTPYQEGCLSIPDYYETIDRPSRVEIVAFDENNQEFKKTAGGLLAVCIQHEIDHLNGVLFVDYLSRLKQGRALEKVKKYLKNKEKK